MQYLLLAYTDAERLDERPAPDFSVSMLDALPLAAFGSIEVRPVVDMAAMRARVGA